MVTIVNLYSEKNGEINRFLSDFYNINLHLENSLKWEKDYENPIEMAEIMGTFIDNNEKYSINMWVSFDKGLFVNVTEHNINDIIKYMYERFPY